MAIFRLGLILLLMTQCQLREHHPELSNEPDTTIAESNIITRIAFGSCNNQKRDQGFWTTIAETEPDLWIWMGDNIYASSRDIAYMRQEYDRLLSDPDYSSFASIIPVTGTWDDHDYGENDGDRNFVHKRESKSEFMNFFGIPADHEVRTRPGIYRSHILNYDEFKIKILLLDTRSFRDPLTSDLFSKQRYQPNPSGDILGQDQWQWLAREVQDSSVKINILVSSIQFQAEDQYFEKWANFPAAKEKMLDLLSCDAASPVIILSGDRHIAEVAQMTDIGLSYPFFEITSSGLTHSFEECRESNRYRISPLITETNFGMLEFYNPGNDSVDVKTIIYSTDGNKLYSKKLFSLPY